MIGCYDPHLKGLVMNITLVSPEPNIFLNPTNVVSKTKIIGKSLSTIEKVLNRFVQNLLHQTYHLALLHEQGTLNHVR